MSRIRSIKPEFFTSEQIAECSTSARLLFVGMWCFCDDGGIHPASAKRLKMEVFPADDLTVSAVQAMVDELLANRLIEEYEVAGERYWRVTGWKHQKIERPSYKYPKPADEAYSPNARRQIAERSPNGIGDESPNARRMLADDSPPEGSRREGKGEEEEKILPAPAGSVPDQPTKTADPGQPQLALIGGRDVRPPPCPHEAIVAEYHRVLPMLPRIAHWSDARKKLLATRWREEPERQVLSWWTAYFEYVARQCPFLVGHCDPKPGRQPFLADLEWLVRPSNLLKVIEGKYEQVTSNG